MRLSEGIPFKTCANPRARDQNIKRANVYENGMVETYHDSSCSRAGKKEYTPPPWHPFFHGLSPDPAKKTMVYTFFQGKQGKRVYTTGPERRVYTIDASDPEKEKKEAFHGCGVYFSLP